MYTEHTARATGALMAGYPAEDPDTWSREYDAWLDSPAGRRWLDEQSDARGLAASADAYGTRPGLTY